MLNREIESKIREHDASLEQITQQKADLEYVDTKIGNMGNTKTFKGSVLFANLPVSGNTVDDYYYVSDQTTNYCWNGTDWVNIGNNLNIGEKSQSISILSASKLGKNLFNKSIVSANVTLSSVGSTYALAGYTTTNYYIEVLPNTTYAFTNGYQMCWYDSSKAFISRINLSANSILISPANAYFAKITLVSTNINTMQMEKNTVCTTYEDFNYIIPKENIEKPNLLIEDLPNEIPYDKTNYITLGKNLLDMAQCLTGYYVLNTSGIISGSSRYSVSSYIQIIENTNYCISNCISANVRVAFYDITKTFISGMQAPTNPITTPSNAVYIRFSFDTGNIPQLEKSNLPTYFEPYGYKIPNLIFKKDEVLLFLPSEICIAVGRTIELYNKQVCWCGNINNYHFKWECSVGKSMKRKWSYTGVAEKIGTYPLTCTVYDNSMNVVSTATTTIKIVPNVISVPKKILPIGDSLTNGKAWFPEVRNLSSSQISYIGTRWNGDVQGGYFNHEGRSGATAGWYLANSAYTFEANGVTSANPFWNPNTSQFDYNYYKNTYSINPDIVQIFLGTNGITLDPTTNTNNIKAIVDGIRTSDTTIPIYVVFTLYRGDQDGIGNQLSTDGYSAGSGIWKLEEDRKVYNLMVALNEALKNYTNLYFIPVSLTHDSEYNFQSTTSTPVNPRSSITEYIHSEATHPSASTAGYLQMADIMFSTFAGHMI